jgi:hypothetical protein
MTLKQVLAQLHLELANLSAEGGLGNFQHLSCAGEAAKFSHADKVFQLFEVHGGRLSVLNL